MQFSENKTLWKTNIGSHMWKMNRPTSDIDVYVCYLSDSRSFLLGNAHNNGHQTITDTIDTSSFELGHIVNNIKKGNVNHIWGVISPIIIEPSKEHTALRNILMNNPSKNIFNSVNGLAKHNIKHFLEEKKQGVADDIKLFFKKLNTITRSLRFGIKVLEKGVFEFAATNDTDPKVAYDLVKELNIAYLNSNLPYEIESDIYEQYLYKIRLDNLIVNVNI